MGRCPWCVHIYKREYNRLVIDVRWTADSSCVEKQGIEKGGDSEESLLHWPGSLC